MKDPKAKDIDIDKIKGQYIDRDNIQKFKPEGTALVCLACGLKTFSNSNVLTFSACPNCTFPLSKIEQFTVLPSSRGTAMIVTSPN